MFFRSHLLGRVENFLFLKSFLIWSRLKNSGGKEYNNKNPTTTKTNNNKKKHSEDKEEPINRASINSRITEVTEVAVREKFSRCLHWRQCRCFRWISMDFDGFSAPSGEAIQHFPGEQLHEQSSQLRMPTSLSALPTHLTTCRISNHSLTHQTPCQAS